MSKKHIVVCIDGKWIVEGAAPTNKRAPFKFPAISSHHTQLDAVMACHRYDGTPISLMDATAKIAGVPATDALAAYHEAVRRTGDPDAGRGIAAHGRDLYWALENASGAQV